MAITVMPEVWINNRRVACTKDQIETAPVAIRGFSITWGRDEYMVPDVSPASVTLTMLDTTSTWADRIRDGVAVGLTVEIRWNGTGATTVGPVTMFRGRIRTATAQPHSLTTSSGETAWTIELECSDRTADLGNAIAPPQEWPREKMITRANRVRDLGLAAGAGIDQVYFWPGYVDSMCWPLDVKDKSALDLIGAMYASMGNDSYAYDPDANVIRQAIRLSQAMQVNLGTFDDSHGAVIPVASDITVDGITYPGIGLGGCELRGVPEIIADVASDLNRLECTWKVRVSNDEDFTTIKENVNPGDHRRVLAWESWFDDGLVIDPTLDNVWARARNEGRRPRHPEFVAKPGKTFVSERMARWLLQAWENTRPAFIAGNLAYRWLMRTDPAYPPIVAPIGGETTWDPEAGWACMMRVHWIHQQTPPTRSATWESLQQQRTSTTQPSYPWWYDVLGIPKPPPVTVGSPTPERDLKWGDAQTAGGYHWDQSVTWGDTQHVPTTGTQVKDILK